MADQKKDDDRATAADPRKDEPAKPKKAAAGGYKANRNFSWAGREGKEGEPFDASGLDEKQVKELERRKLIVRERGEG